MAGEGTGHIAIKVGFSSYEKRSLVSLGTDRQTSILPFCVRSADIDLFGSGDRVLLASLGADAGGALYLSIYWSLVTGRDGIEPWMSIDR